MQNNFTHIILGSSPLSLAEAICLQLTGNKVLVIEQSPAFGGSWKIIQTKKFIDMETGCHVMYRNKMAREFMQKKIGIDMLDFNPEPRIIRYNSNVNYKYTSFWDVIDVAFGVHFKKGEIRTVLAYIKRALVEVFDFQKYYYPQGGSKVLVEQLIEKARQAGVSFGSYKVDEIQLQDNQVLINAEQQRLSANQIVITPNTNLQKITSADQTFEISKAEKRSVANMFLLLNNSPKQMISYIGVKKNKIFRIADMTYENQHYLQKGQRVLCAQIRIENLKKDGDAELMKDEVITFLKKFNLVDPKVELVDWELYYYDYYHRHENFLKELPVNFRKNVQILRSHNFTISMAEIAERWGDLIPDVK
jgi:hypothetical protein